MKRKRLTGAPPAPPVEISSHPIHPGHKLLLVTGDDVEFVCDGCKEPGAGGRYTCEHDGEQHHRDCNFDLHIGCALAPDVLPAHPLFAGCAFVLLHAPPEPADGRVCDACGDDVRGLVYHCFDRGLDLHPCCARLPERVALDGLVFELCAGRAPSRSCALCTGKGRRRCRRKFLAYRADWDGEPVYLHVACVKEMAYEILKPGHCCSCDGGGKAIVQASKAPADLKVVLAEKKEQAGSKRLKRFLKIVGFLVRVVIGVIFGDPTAMVAALVGVVFSGG